MEINTGNTAWVLMSAALVLFMTPGLALFYGGMVRGKNVLGMLMQNVFAMGLLAILWVAVVFSLAFGDAGNGGVIGNLDFAFMKDVGVPLPSDDWFSFLTIPFVLFCAYQMTFAIITPALITGATADRLKFSAYAVFIGIWLVVVYGPVAHWVFGGGWLAERGALDFAGGAVVHINAGAAALALVLILGPRKGYPDTPMLPHNLPMTVIGTGILWFGWTGLQRRLGPGGRRHRRLGHHEHLPGGVGRHARLAGDRAAEERARHHTRARPRVPWPAWWPSRRARATSVAWRRCTSGPSPGWSATSG